VFPTRKIKAFNSIYIYTYTHIYRGCLCICESVHTGWRRLIGSPGLQIIFHKRATKYRALLRKMSHKDKGSYESSPPCSCARRSRVYTCMHIHICIGSVCIYVRKCTCERVYACGSGKTIYIHMHNTHIHRVFWCTCEKVHMFQ